MEFSLVNFELDGESQSVDLSQNTKYDKYLDVGDVIIYPYKSNVLQLVKVNKNFKEFKVEFDIHIKNMDILNDKYTETLTLNNQDTFSYNNLGNQTGQYIIESTGTDVFGDTFNISTSNNHIDFYAAKVTDDFMIMSDQYTQEEEFGDTSLDSYNTKNIGWSGSSMYLKDAIMVYIRCQNISNYEDVIINNLCHMYGLKTIFEGNVNGRYFTKDGKKVGSYSYDGNGRFWLFFNTKDIPTEIKNIFIRKDFNDTSYLDITLDSFKQSLEDKFNL